MSAKQKSTGFILLHLTGKNENAIEKLSTFLEIKNLPNAVMEAVRNYPDACQNLSQAKSELGRVTRMHRSLENKIIALITDCQVGESGE